MISVHFPARVNTSSGSLLLWRITVCYVHTKFVKEDFNGFLQKINAEIAREGKTCSLLVTSSKKKL